MKKSCDNCRAFYSGRCCLGYSINVDYTSRIYKTYSPAEWCEKPKTYSQYLYLKKINDKKMNPHLKEFINFIKPYLNDATDGKYSGHDFNSYFPKTLRESIPLHFRDLVQTSLQQIAIV